MHNHALKPALQAFFLDSGFARYSIPVLLSPRHKRRLLEAVNLARVHLGEAETIIKCCQCGSVANSNHLRQGYGGQDVASCQLFHHAASSIENWTW